ncbi:MAG: arsenite methyltransferase [SAR324 cluster bacterium]
MNGETLKSAVQERYGSVAKKVLRGQGASCCGPRATSAAGSEDPITSNLYDAEQVAGVPQDALLASLGCGNPTALAELKPGEVVLDLGSGGGIDVLLSARRVGPAGKAYGLDMTPEMLELARRNQQRAGIGNVEFLRGSIESIPLPDASVDVVISNCVINLSGDKDRVLREAFRVLKPGGRFAVSDIVVRRPLPDAARKSMALWTGCIAGALLEADYVQKLRNAGFEAAQVEPTRIYTRGDAEDLAQAAQQAGNAETVAALDGAIMSAFIRARKPGAQAVPASAGSAAGAACCGGPAPAASAACCADDAASQATGSAGCGCGPTAAPEAKPRPAGKCC